MLALVLDPASSNEYVTRMGNGLLIDCMVIRSFGTYSVTSMTYWIRRPRNEARRSTRVPTSVGGSVSLRALEMPPIHFGSFSASIANDATSARGRPISMAAITSTAIRSSNLAVCFLDSGIGTSCRILTG